MNRIALTVLVALVFLWCPAHAGDDADLTKLLAGGAAEFPGKMTAHVKQLTTGREASVAPEDPMSSMSVIKLGILVKAFQLASAN